MDLSRVATLVALSLTALTAVAEDAPYSAPVAEDFPRNVYWGDLHVHSNLSPDSYSFGNARLTPDAAYRFAKGELLDAHIGKPVQLRRPLDFLMVSDHAEFLGIFPKLQDRDELLMSTSLGERWGGYLDNDDNGSVMGEFVQFIQNPNYEQELPESFRKSVWQEAAAFADNHNEPGKFTAFVGYEWTSMVEGNNLHRVVVFKGDAEQASREAPFSSLDSQDPEDLWAWMAEYEDRTGGDVLAIPHNGNLSNGIMFSEATLSGEPLTKDYAERRSTWEPLYEMTQVKGDAEAHPFLSPDDEFAAFENWDADNIGRGAAKEPWMLKHEYARPALKLGLELAEKLGANPYDFGMIGSTDSHTTFATADDDNFWGKFVDSMPTPERATNNMGGRLWLNWKLAASGYAAIWAKENTREALFEAMERKEVYATTGPRITLRMFGGWSFADGDELTPDLAALGYAKGVPMGSTLPNITTDAAPTFLVAALKDPDGANLDRIQIIKGWLDESGEAQEKIFTIALSDNRSISRRGKIKPLASTVDAENATYTNEYGAAELLAFWQDPEFDQSKRAFYYARVIEIPTPRWTTYDAAKLGVELVPEIPRAIQERAYGSPIWYTPR